MCKLGDIIVIKEFRNEYGKKINRHSFVVINDEKNSIEGMNYDFISNMLCSFHSDEHKNRKLKFKENYEIAEKMIEGENLNEKRWNGKEYNSLGYLQCELKNGN